MDIKKIEKAIDKAFKVVMEQYQEAYKETENGFDLDKEQRFQIELTILSFETSFKVMKNLIIKELMEDKDE